MTDAPDRLLGPAEIRRLAEQIGLRPTKTLGQNFVHDANTVRRIVEISGVGPDDHVLEVGPGLGSLTLALLQTAAAVTAVEIDPRLAALLPETAQEHLSERAGSLRVVTGDALKCADADVRRADDDADAHSVPAMPTALVANLPYNVGVPVLLHLLAELPSLRSALVMMQSEVVDRLVAPPGSRTYGAPSAKLAWYGTARRAGSVSRSVFWPVPRVDSALVALSRDRPPARDFDAPDVDALDVDALDVDALEVDAAAVFAAVDAAFSQRRKTLRSALARWAGTPARVEHLCRVAGIDPRARGETLAIGDFAALAAARDGDEVNTV